MNAPWLGALVWSAAMLSVAVAGPFPGAAGTAGSTAVPAADPSIVSWATAVIDYSPGSNVDGFFRYYPEDDFVVGPTVGDDVFHVASLGRGGSITLGFDRPIADGPGFDFAVFENAFENGFLELAFVEVSQDGNHFVRFPTTSLTSAPVGSLQTNGVDPSDLDGFAGKYRIGFGTPFDIGALGLDYIVQIRLVDVVGDGATPDSSGRPIYDPYPTPEPDPDVDGPAGFDIDAVAVLNHAITYGGWLERYFLTAERDNQAIAGGDADPDGDGQANLVEYALGGNPRDAGDAGLLQRTEKAEEGGIRFALSRVLLKTDLSITVVRSDGLESWIPLAGSSGAESFTSIPGSGIGITETGDPITSEVAIDLPTGGSQGYFSLHIAIP